MIPPANLRKAEIQDIPEVLKIYNHGIEERIATFETRLRTEVDIKAWLDSGYPFVISQIEGRVISFAVTFPYSSRECYLGIAEFSVYVHKDYRGKGIGKLTMQYLLDQCERKGFWKLVSRVFSENVNSRKMLRSTGFREVGIYEKHGKLDGIWRDTVIVEFIFAKNLGQT